MGNWNPGSPGYLGLEFAAKNPPASGPSAVVASPLNAVIETIPSTVTESVDIMGAYVRGVAASWALLAETFEEGDEETGPITTTIYRPNNSANVSGWVSTEGTFVNGINTGNGFATSDGVSAGNQLSSGEKHFDLEFPTAAQPAGTRILAVRLCWDAAVSNAYPGNTNPMYLTITGNGTSWFSGIFTAGSVTAGTHVVTRKSMGEIRPNGVASQPWTLAELQSMDTSALRVRFSATFADSQSGTAQYTYAIYDIWLEVDYCTENRKTTQVVLGTNTAPAWVTWTPRTATGGTNLAKVAGTDLTLCLRQPRVGDANQAALFGQSFLFSAPYLLGFNDVPLSPFAMYPAPTIDATGAITDLGTASPDRMVGIQMDVSGTQSVDAQPYVQALGVEVAGTVQQEITGTVATYDGALLPLRFEDVPGPLTVRLRRRSDNVTMATATITEADWNDAPSDPVLGEWKMVQGSWDSPPTLAAVQYYFDFTAAVSPGSWFVQALYANGVTGVASYGGITNVATYEGGDVPSADISVGAVIASDPPDGLAAVAFADDLPDGPVATGGPCDQPGVMLDWDNPGVPAFGRYEIQRSDAFTDWQTFARITDPNAIRFYDYGPVLGYESAYRIRVVDTTGVHSEWSDSVMVFVPRPDCDGTPACGLWLTSNEAPEYNVAYPDVYGNGDASREYLFPEADEVVFEQFFDRDYTVAFQPLERSGTVFSRRLLIGAVELAAGVRRGPDLFDRIRDLAKAPLSHVIVRDESGNRWYATIQVRTGTTRMPGNFAYADVTFTETTATPATPNVITL